MQPDKETKEVITEQAELKGMVAGRGWGIARARLQEKILDLQNIFNVKDGDPVEKSIDLEARKLTAEALFDWLRDIEGTAQSADEVIKQFDKPYIVKL